LFASIGLGRNCRVDVEKAPTLNLQTSRRSRRSRRSNQHCHGSECIRKVRTNWQLSGRFPGTSLKRNAVATADWRERLQLVKSCGIKRVLKALRERLQESPQMPRDKHTSYVTGFWARFSKAGFTWKLDHSLVQNWQIFKDAFEAYGSVPSLVKHLVWCYWPSWEPMCRKSEMHNWQETNSL